ncbi:hypothetical protein ACFLQU_04530 [Verrucomicrobiota bacterium]
MMYETPDEHPIKGEPRRRWFTDDYFDLFVWYNPDGTHLGFQLCYDKNGDQHAFTFRQDIGISHKRVDDGDRCQRNAAEFLVPDGVFPWDMILSRFLKSSEDIESGIVDMVAKTIRSQGGV